jgi:glycosyltransferase involved in cell wall biosynthesis
MANVFSTTSLSEANPLSVIEAMAAGLPFVGLTAGWWDEFPNHQTAGLLTDHNTPALVAAIRRFCEDRSGRDAMSMHAKQVSQAFDIRTVTAQWLAIYDSVLNRTAY